ncbi:MAG: DUF6642 family protein [Myxococcota bacterium]
MTKSKTSTSSRGRKRGHGVFCLEGDWWHITDRTTIEPALQLLQANGEFNFEYLHRDVGVIEEFEHYLNKWTQRGLARYPILYLGFHGSPGYIDVGDARRKESNVSLDWLEERLEGKCAKRVIHFGGCGTLDLHGKRLNRFVRRTGALAICGYRSDTDWLKAAAFEILLLAELQRIHWDGRGIRVVPDRMRKNAAGLFRELEFRFVTG